ncbi:MAG: hypothetical protein LGB07_05535 [Sulfurovum sp.]|nr:hypothetical protein [Sulfurovum sp.]MCB4745094.1 hypothetical protein [Sulfurovum sp.]MCB4746181.1 hypothetical protein [Sulfurovum sp.]MCB4749458.1 hypothetical protein [Sulfurovum sp.]MCB4750436.1 hypothetical protein [Sulfurovum sp.]
MKNILIFADGSIARHFVEWVGHKRVMDNHYYVAHFHEDAIPEKMSKNITLIEADPTSYIRIKYIMDEAKFSHVFIVMENREDAVYTLKNIRMVEDKIRIILVNQWDDSEIDREEENVTFINVDELITAHLYDQLPNAPVVAQNVGLGKGEIMEIHVPFGSTFAFRHVGSILQRKWKIVAIYRHEKQILPTNATTILPNDTLLVIGKPLVLDGVYRTINRRIGLFPEPFGKDIYLILDFRHDQTLAQFYLDESLYLLEKLEEKQLFIRVICPNNFELINSIRQYESKNITISVCYDDKDILHMIEYDMQEYDIGLIMSSIKTFSDDTLMEILYNLRKVVYLFGDQHLNHIKKSIILMDDERKMESISSTAFDVSESLEMSLHLCDFDPEGEFENKKIIVEHYETLAHIFNMEIKIEQRVSNPIRELDNMESVLQIAPFEKILHRHNFWKFISTKISDFLLTTRKHPKLLVPYTLEEDV